MTYKIVLLDKNSKVPKRGSSGAAGYDLTSVKSLTIKARGRALVPTGLAIQVPLGSYGRIAPRSGLAYKNSIDVAAGVIDYDYTGPVGVILVNNSDVDFDVSIGDRIAQLIFEVIITPEPQVVTSLSETNRGEGGFGSTGTSSASPLLNATPSPLPVPEIVSLIPLSIKTLVEPQMK
jgi:dUTP pyrophosphatase